MSDASALLKKGPIRRRIASRRAARSMLGGGSLEEGGGVGEVACRGSSVSEGEEAEASPKPWAEASREVYEEQLDHLHGQLMDSMLRSQALQGEGAWSARGGGQSTRGGVRSVPVPVVSCQPRTYRVKRRVW